MDRVTTCMSRLAPLVRTRGRVTLAFAIIGGGFAVVVAAAEVARSGASSDSLAASYTSEELFINRGLEVDGSLSEGSLQHSPHAPTDGWGNPLVLESVVDPDGTVRRRLVSLGADGVPGGTGRSADMSLKCERVPPDLTEQLRALRIEGLDLLSPVLPAAFFSALLGFVVGPPQRRLILRIYQVIGFVAMLGLSASIASLLIWVASTPPSGH